MTPWQNCVGARLDTDIAHTISRGLAVKYIWADKKPARTSQNKRAAERRAVTLPARLTWKDQRGTPRFASVVTRDVSEFGVYVECPSAVAIPLYRIVQFQLEHPSAPSDGLPPALRQGRILSAVYRVSPATAAGARQGLALRLMVDPKRRAIDVIDTRATA
jgi:hypothetical protein